MSFWDERFSAEEYVYGTEPNDFLREVAHHIPPGRVVSLGEGEGRNACFLAGLGHPVVAVDASRVGLTKTERLAKSRGLSVELVEADLTSYVLPTDLAGVVTIFAHVPHAVRRRIHAALGAALAPGGVFILEHYRPEQLQFATGGPRDVDLLPTLESLRDELTGLELVIARAVERDIFEGKLHGGRSATVQIVARKPAH